MFPPRRSSSEQPSRTREEPWLARGLKPENFVPGLVIGFLMGLFLDLSTSYRGHSLKGRSRTLSKQLNSASDAGGEELKMVLVVRQDLKMGAGKIASQCAHAATGMYVDLLQRLDKTKPYVVGAGLFTGVTVALYPVSVIKTRMQVASKEIAQQSAFSTFRNILKVDGIPGLYRGFGTVITGAIPARIIFLTSLETTKAASLKIVEPFKFALTLITVK